MKQFPSKVSFLFILVVRGRAMLDVVRDQREEEGPVI